MTEISHTGSRFAVYLIPPYRVAQAVTNIHQLLHKQFGFAAAGRFPVHTTLKGFFKKVDDPLAPMVARLDTVFADLRPFPVHFTGYRNNEIGVGLNVSRIGDSPNPEMLALRERVVAAVRPFIAPDCDFVKEDLGHPFQAHLTLAFRDISPTMHDDVLAYLQEAPVPDAPFIARTFHLLQFFSQDWAGAWWQTTSWQLLKSWHISGKHDDEKEA